MRDPVELTISHYWHRVMYANEYRPLKRAIEEDNRYRDVSYYAMQLTQYFAVFKQNQLKTLTLEELIENRLEVMKSVQQWLGVDSSCAIPRL